MSLGQRRHNSDPRVCLQVWGGSIWAGCGRWSTHRGPPLHPHCRLPTYARLRWSGVEWGGGGLALPQRAMRFCLQTQVPWLPGVDSAAAAEVCSIILAADPLEFTGAIVSRGLAASSSCPGLGCLPAFPFSGSLPPPSRTEAPTLWTEAPILPHRGHLLSVAFPFIRTPSPLATDMPSVAPALPGLRC